MDLDYSSESDLDEVIAFVYQLLLHLLPNVCMWDSVFTRGVCGVMRLNQPYNVKRCDSFSFYLFLQNLRDYSSFLSTFATFLLDNLLL